MERRLIDNYTDILHNIEDAREICGWTPYALENRRQDAHLALFNSLKETLKPADGFGVNDMFLRSKELFARLDKIFRIYYNWDLNLKKYEDSELLAEALEKFLLKTETRNYLEGKTQHINGVI